MIVGQQQQQQHPSTISTTTTTANNNILTAAAVKKSFHNNNNNNNNKNNIISGETTKQGFPFRIRLRRQRRQTTKSTTIPPTTTGPATTYIPSGMSLEDYQMIKQQEALEESTKNYGAWGPRFAMTERPPEGDWMVMPQLWTRGAVVAGVDNGPTNSSGDYYPTNAPNAILQRIGQKIPALVLSTILLDSIIVGVTMYKTVTIDWRKLLSIALRLPFFTKWKQLAFFHLTRMHAVQTCLVVATAPLLDRYYLDRVNRYRLWSKRRTVILSTLGSVGLLGLWAVVLGALKRAGIL